MRTGFRFNIDGLHIVYQLNSLRHGRLGLAVSRKFGNAVKRNRFKRLLRETFRHHDVRFSGVDVLVIPAKNQSASSNDTHSTCRALDMIIARLAK